MLAFPLTSLPVREVVDWLYESAGAARRDGSLDALRLMTAHRAKGLEFRHVIVMDCGDWNRAEDERRLLYVSMTRAKETLTLFRADTSPNPFLADLDAAESVVAFVPQGMPGVRPELQTRFRSLSPADVDIGFAGRHPDGHRVHGDIACVEPGDTVQIRNRELVTDGGRVVGKLSKNTSLPDGNYAAKVTDVMARARADAAAVSGRGSGGSVGGAGGGGRAAGPVRAGDQLSLHNSRSFGSSAGSSSTTVFHKISLSIAKYAWVSRFRIDTIRLQGTPGAARR